MTNATESSVQKKTVDDYPLVLTPSHVAEIMSISYITAIRVMNSESFPRVDVGRMKRVSRDAFFRWLNQFEKEVK